jgi:hypothetical protein
VAASATVATLVGRGVVDGRRRAPWLYLVSRRRVDVAVNARWKGNDTHVEEVARPPPAVSLYILPATLPVASATV